MGGVQFSARVYSSIEWIRSLFWASTATIRARGSPQEVASSWRLRGNIALERPSFGFGQGAMACPAQYSAQPSLKAKPEFVGSHDAAL